MNRAAARTSRTPLPALPQEIIPRSVEDGYRIQSEVHRLLAPELGPLVGYKIGCTSEVMQKYLAIPHPCAGGVPARAAHPSGVVLNASDYVEGHRGQARAFHVLMHSSAAPG